MIFAEVFIFLLDSVGGAEETVTGNICSLKCQIAIKQNKVEQKWEGFRVKQQMQKQRRC